MCFASRIRDAGLTLSEALGHAMLSSGLQHIFCTATDQLRIMLRINWLKAHLFLLQENSPSAICSLQDVRFKEISLQSNEKFT